MFKFLKRKSFIIPGASVLLALVMVLSGVQLGHTIDQKPLQIGSITIGYGNPVIKIGMAGVEAAGTADYTCSGANDDVVVQTALNALPANGGKLSFLAGNYSFSATVSRLIPNVTIAGDGNSVRFTFDGATPLFTAGGNGWSFQNIVTDAGGINFGATLNWTEINVIEGTNAYGFRAQNANAILNNVTTTTANVTQNLTASNVTIGGTSNWVATFLDGDGNDFADIRGNQTAGNLFFGWNAGQDVTTGSSLLAIGRNAGLYLTTAVNDVFLGRHAGRHVTTGSQNVYVGLNAGMNQVTGNGNTAIGEDAMAGQELPNLLTAFIGSNNTFLGWGAGFSVNGSNNIGIGQWAGAAGNNITSGSYNMILGNFLDVPSPTGNYQLNFGTLFQGTLPYVDGNSVSAYARDSGIGAVPVMRWVSSADPYTLIGRNDTGVSQSAVTEILRLQANSGSSAVQNGQGLSITAYLNNFMGTPIQQGYLNFSEVNGANTTEQSHFQIGVMTGGALVNPVDIRAAAMLTSGIRITMTPSSSINTGQTAGQASLYAANTTGNAATMGIVTEQNVTAESVTSNATLTIKINGLYYKLLLNGG